MTIDDRARRAARDLQADVDTTSDPRAALEAVVSSAGRGRRPWMAVAAAVIVVLGLVGATVALSTDGGEQVSTEDTEGVDPSPPEQDPDAGPPVDLGLGAPTDGKDSLELAVTATPSTDLTPGDTVTVTGEGFTPGQGVGIVLCGGLAGDVTVHGAAACDIGTVTYVDPDDQGHAEGTFELTRLVTTPALGTVDCGAPTARCSLAMGQVSDYDVSGFAPIAFRSDLPELVPAEVVVSPSEGLRHGDPITVTLTGLTGRVTGVDLCLATSVGDPTTSTPPVAPLPAPGEPCWYYPVGVLAAGGGEGFEPGLPPDAGGRAEVSLEAWRTFATPASRKVDCAVEQCVIRVSTVDALAPAPVPLGFDPDSPPPTTPTLTVTPTEGIVPGDQVTVSAEGLEPGVPVNVTGCTGGSTGEGCGLPLASLVADQEGRGTVTFAIAAPGSIGADCTRPGACAVSLGAFTYMADGQPYRPVVPPEPVPVTFASNKAPDGGP